VGDVSSALAYFTARAGDRVRFGVFYGGTWRHAFWIRVSVEGDLYCTFGYGEFIERAAYGEGTVDERGTSSFRYGNDTLGEAPKGGRVSFHASGQINLGDRTLNGKSLAERDRQEPLCVLVFEHPSALPPLGDVGERDIQVELEVDESRALMGALLLAPDNATVFPATVVDELGTPRRHLVVTFEGRRAPESRSLTAQVVFALGPRVSEWPPSSYFVLAPGVARQEGR
jgi:hypothetical protein